MATSHSALLPKVRSNASWNKLTEDQRAQLEHWLFEDCLSYNEAWKRAQKELAYTGSVSSVRRFRDRLAQQRTIAGLVGIKWDVQHINSSPIKTAELTEAGMKIVAQLFLQQVTAQPDQAKHWGFLAKLLLRHQATATRAAARREETQVRQGQLQLARDQWQDQINERTRIAREEQQWADEQAVNEHLASKRKDTPGYAFNRWSNRMRFKVYHKHIPDDELLPENEADDAAFKALAALPKDTPEEERHRVAAEAYRQVKERLVQQAEAEQQEKQEHLEYLKEQHARFKAAAANRPSPPPHQE